MIKAEKTIERNVIYKGRVLEYVVDTVDIDGSCATREMVLHPGGVGVLAIDEQGYAYLVRQFRKPYDDVICEIPAGKLDPNEPPEECGKRELTEETGLVAKSLISLGKFYPSVGYTNEVIHLYLATEFSFGDANPDDDEFVDVVKIAFAQLCSMVMSGEIKDGKTIAAVLKAKNIMDNK